MTNPVTHLIWGYVLGSAMSPAPRYLFLGMMMGILLDLDQVIPGLLHHGFVHSPVFVLTVSGILYVVTRDRLVFIISLTVMMSHLVLDTVATQWGVMWLWPLSTHEFVIWTIDDLAALAVIKVYALLFPAYLIWQRWRRDGESPLAVFEWLDGHIPRPVTYVGLASFGVAMVAVLWVHYVQILLG
jgi:hypothetical protein